MIVKEQQNEASHLPRGSLWAQGSQSHLQELKRRRVIDI